MKIQNLLVTFFLLGSFSFSILAQQKTSTTKSSKTSSKVATVKKKVLSKDEIMEIQQQLADPDKSWMNARCQIMNPEVVKISKDYDRHSLMAHRSMGMAFNAATGAVQISLTFFPGAYSMGLKYPNVYMTKVNVKAIPKDAPAVVVQLPNRNPEMNDMALFEIKSGKVEIHLDDKAVVKAQCRMED